MPIRQIPSLTKFVTVLAVAGGLVLCLAGATERRAEAQPAIDASLTFGIDKDTTAIGRLLAGGIYALGNFAAEAHVGFDGFLRVNNEAGIAARSFSLLNLGARYGLSPRFVGPFVSGGAGFGIFTGKPHERKIKGDAKTCASARIPEGQPNDQCFYRIDKSINGRFGFGYGFSSSKSTTVAARIDVTYWLFSLNNFEDQPEGAPIPNMVERPQATWSVLFGLEFMRWQ